MKKMLKIALALITITTICLTNVVSAFAIAPVTFETIKTVISNDSYEIEDAIDTKTLDGLDIQGKINNEWYSSTYENYGFHVFLNTGDSDWVLSGCQSLDNYSESKVVNMSYVFNTNNTAPQNFNGLTLDVATTQQNNFLKIQYTVKNTLSTPKTYSLATTSDVETAHNDSANLNVISNGKGVKMVNPNNGIMFIMDSSSGTPIDNAWVGHWDNDYFIHMFDDCEDSYSYTEGDSAMCYSWVNRTIAAGETNTYSALVEIAAQQPPKIEFTGLNQTTKLLLGTVLDDNIGALTLYYKIDNGEYQTIDNIVSNGVKKEFTIDTSSLACGFSHTIKAYVKDADGQDSIVITYPITIEHLYTDTVVTPASCTTKGVLKRTCSVCQETHNDEIELIPHDYNDGEITKPATCAAPGEKTFVCKICGNKKTETIPTIDHNYINGKCTICNAEQPEPSPSPDNNPPAAVIDEQIPPTGSALRLGSFATLGLACAVTIIVSKRKKEED